MYLVKYLQGGFEQLFYVYTKRGNYFGSVKKKDFRITWGENYHIKKHSNDWMKKKKTVYFERKKVCLSSNRSWNFELTKPIIPFQQ